MFNKACINIHKLKRAFRKLEKIYIHWRDNELPGIKEDREWRAEKEREIQNLKDNAEESKK